MDAGPRNKKIKKKKKLIDGGPRHRKEINK